MREASLAFPSSLSPVAQLVSAWFHPCPYQPVTARDWFLRCQLLLKDLFLSRIFTTHCRCVEYHQLELIYWQHNVVSGTIFFHHMITARVAKRAKVMFSQACVTHSVQLGEGPCDHVTYAICIYIYTMWPIPFAFGVKGQSYNGRAVRILQECILVNNLIFNRQYYFNKYSISPLGSVPKIRVKYPFIAMSANVIAKSSVWAEPKGQVKKLIIENWWTFHLPPHPCRWRL